MGGDVLGRIASDRLAGIPVQTCANVTVNELVSRTIRNRLPDDEKKNYWISHRRREPLGRRTGMWARTTHAPQSALDREIMGDHSQWSSDSSRGRVGLRSV